MLMKSISALSATALIKNLLLRTGPIVLARSGAMINALTILAKDYLFETFVNRSILIDKNQLC